MRNFQVEITEIFQIKVNIEAEIKEQAFEKVRSLYNEGQYLINDSNLVATEFDINP